MLRLIDQVSDRRCSLFDIVLSKIEVFCGSVTVCIRAERCDQVSCMVQGTGLFVRMDNVFPCIQAVHSSGKDCIPLRRPAGLIVRLDQVDHCLYSLIRNFLAGDYSRHSRYRIYRLVPVIALRCLDFLYIHDRLGNRDDHPRCPVCIRCRELLCKLCAGGV